MPIPTLPPLRTFDTNDALAFVEGNGVDASGRTIEDYLKFDADKWEACHDHVQWAFPSHIASRFNLEAPVVDMEEFSNRLTMVGHVNIMKLLANYLTSLGFFQDNEVWHADLTHARTKYWLSPRNHNYQRISRVLNLLSWIDPDLAIKLLGEFLDVAHTYFNEYVKVTQAGINFEIPVIDAETVVYWSKAAIGKL